MIQKHKNDLLGVIQGIRDYQFKSPEDDPIAQDANVLGFKQLIKRLKFKVKRIDDEFLKEEIEKLNSSFSDIYTMYDVGSDVDPILDELEFYLEEDDYQSIDAKSYEVFIDEALIEELNLVDDSQFDVSKLVQYCIELNSNYSLDNYISCALLIRAIINHIPPVFGKETFEQVVAHSPKSIKEIIGPLEENLRKIADLHTHRLIKENESLPSYNQIDPFKANIEILLQEITNQLATAS